ncbi:MAG: peptide chain release factor N(5)-glutamine methyltransferase [Flavobacteriales bacterium]|nr:MAG: peptide chain release factor N(5)-glutamine methyltransferase [Flavobacteriales bacterium]
MRVADNHVSSLLELYRQELAPLHGEREALAMASCVFQERLGWRNGDLQQRKNEQLSESELLKVYMPLKRLRSGEPLQYVLGTVRFHGLDLLCDKRALIPRPETEELVEAIIHEQAVAPHRIIDIGTGSGCIALAMKKAFRDAEVLGLDASEEALALARENGARTALEVHWNCADMLDRSQWPTPGAFDLVISNPPYVPSADAGSMAPSVVDHEPHSALFVPDNDPLLFYRTIAEFGLQALRGQGQLWFEVHHERGKELPALLGTLGYRSAQAMADMSGNTRFVHAVR